MTNDEKDQPIPPAGQRQGYHVPLYIFGGILGAASLGLLVFGMTEPGAPGVLSLALACTVLSAVVVAATALYRRVDSVLAVVRELRRDVAVLAFDVTRTNEYAHEGLTQAQRTAASTAYDVRRAVTWVEQGFGMLRQMTPLLDRLVTQDNELARAANRRDGRPISRRRGRTRRPKSEDVDSFLEAIDKDNVLPMPNPRKIRGEDGAA